MSELPPFDPYHVLGVDRTADAPSIKKAYRKLALLKHPDKCTDDTLKQLRTDEFQRLNEAYDILGDDEKRKRHDALVKLEALRKKAFANGPPRPVARAATFQNAYPGATSTAYTSRGATNVEDRVPKGFYEDEDRYTRRSYTDYDSTRRSAGGTARTDRARAERDEERRRNDRRRDEQVKEARSKKYEDMDRYVDRDSKREEPSREKYDGWEDNLKAYTSRAPPPEPRPGIGRRTSTREVPRNIYATRSRAAPKESRASREDRNILEKERELLQKEQDRLARLQRLDAEREAERRQREQEREAEKQARRDREEREKERERKREREATREREAREREARDREARPRRRENVEPYERRPATLQHNHSSPPNLLDGGLPRVRTEPIISDSVPYPAMPRSFTMPSVPAASNTARRPAGPSKLRETVPLDSGYSSNSTTASETRGTRTTAKPVKVTNHYYGADGTPGRSYTVETHEPSSSSSRRRSPSVERPPGVASKMANLAKHAMRPGTASGSYATGSYPLPMRSRSPERSSRRERDYTRNPPRPLYGERTPSFNRDGVTFSRPITSDDILYSGAGQSRREAKDAYGYSPSPRFDRRGSMPIPPMPQ